MLALCPVKYTDQIDKKLTVGVASVLIGFTFMGMNASANTTAEANSDAD